MQEMIYYTKKSEKFYHKSEFDEWCVNNDIKKWNIEYYKGLGSLEDCDYKDITLTDSAFIYCDPPYQNTKEYETNFNDDVHGLEPGSDGRM